MTGEQQVDCRLTIVNTSARHAVTVTGHAAALQPDTFRRWQAHAAADIPSRCTFPLKNAPTDNDNQVLWALLQVDAALQVADRAA
jgi:hypothetical protein